MVVAILLGLATACAAFPARAATADVAAAAGHGAERPRLELGANAAGLLGGAALVLWGAAELERASDDVTRCRWCDPPGFDRWTRAELAWHDARAASTASDILLFAVPIGSVAAVAWLAAREGDRREIAEDVFLVAAAVALTDALTRGVQHATGRLRPQAWDAGGSSADRDLRSFFSGHASRVFAAAAAAAQVSRLRARRGWRWVAAAGLTAAAATAWLRVAGDQHWTTDVLAGAAAGAAVGWSVPIAVLRPVTRGTGAALVPAPGGLALVF